MGIVFRGTYAGSVSCTYRIYERNAPDTVNISKQKFSLRKTDVQGAYYTGNAVTPAVIPDNTDLKENEDYRVVYKNNYNAGKASVTVVGLGSTGNGTACVGTKTLSFSIKKVNIRENVIPNNYTKTYPYKGAPVTLGDLSLSIGSSGYRLKEGTDYTVSYKKNSTAGTATATVKGKGNFKGSVKYTYTIKPVSLADIPDSAVTSVEYSPKGAKLKTVTFGDITLKEGTDYKAKYTYSSKKTKAVGTAVTIELTGKNACRGTSKIFRDVKITAADLNNCIVPSDIVIDSKKVNRKRTVKVKDSAGVALKEGSRKDYTLVWDAANEGRAGKGLTLTILPSSDNYTGKKEVPYRIAAKIASVKNLKINSKIFDGRHPVTITADDIVDGKLKAADFEVVSYKNNTKAGTAQVTIKGRGAYYGTRTLKFKITD